MNERIVYSSDAGRMCPACGRPVRDCRCGAGAGAADEPIPTRVVAKLRMEKKGRGGKTVTVVDGLPRNAEWLKALCQDLKRACGAGGAAQDGAIEIQGDLRERIRAFLLSKGFIVKG
jgi:translation initiation factor 1